jgi:hypothetical protein
MSANNYRKAGNRNETKAIGRQSHFTVSGNRRKTQSGIILPDRAKEKPQEAVVVAVGDGQIRIGFCSYVHHVF